MWKRTLVLLAAGFVGLTSGCCGLPQRYKNRHFTCPQCGETYFSEWFNDPPACHDPCDCYGNFVGYRRNFGRPAYMNEEGPDRVPFSAPAPADAGEPTPAPAEPLAPVAEE